MSEPKLLLLSEPQLEFAHGQLEEHPKDGLFLYGPAERSEHSETMKIGVIGPANLLDLLADFGTLVMGHIAVHVDWGEADIETVAADILALTKVNFNGCNFADGLPVTLKFADAIGEILTAAPNLDGAPLPFKYYI